MKYHQLDVTRHKRSKRVGRGISAGQGKTAGRGTKGQKSRTGSKKKPGFSGGQNPLMQQLPKLPGFKSHRQPAEIIQIASLDSIKDKVIDGHVLAKAGLISSPYVRVKLIGKDTLKSSKTLKIPLASRAAIDSLEQAGGSFEQVKRLQQPKKEA